MSDFKRIDKADMAFYLRVTPGLHNWQGPLGGIGFTDNAGVCHAFVATTPNRDGKMETKCYLNVIDYRKFAGINYEAYKLEKEIKRRRNSNERKSSHSGLLN